MPLSTRTTDDNARALPGIKSPTKPKPQNPQAGFLDKILFSSTLSPNRWCPRRPGADGDPFETGHCGQGGDRGHILPLERSRDAGQSNYSPQINKHHKLGCIHPFSPFATWRTRNTMPALGAWCLTGLLPVWER